MSGSEKMICMGLRRRTLIMLMEIYRLHHHIKLVEYYGKYSHGLYTIPRQLILGVTNRL